MDISCMCSDVCSSDLPRGMVRGGRREEGSGWGTRVYLWRIHVDIWQNQYNIVKLKKKKKNLGFYSEQSIPAIFGNQKVMI